MAEQVKQSVIIHYLTGDEITGTKVIENPFKTLLEMADFFCTMAKNPNVEQYSDYFESSIEYNGRQIQNAKLAHCVVNMYLSNLGSGNNDEWLMFDANELEKLLIEPFFEEYRKTREQLEKGSKRAFPFLDVYCYIRFQALATLILSRESLYDVCWFWNYEDFIEIIFGLGWYNTISLIHKAYGVRWFCEGGDKDPILFKWACYAIVACKKAGTVDEAVLKKELFDVYKELLIALTIRGQKDSLSVLDYIQKCISSFDDDHIQRLLNSTKELKRDNIKLVDQNKQLTEGIKELRSQIEELQDDKTRSDNDKIENIAYRIYCVSPQNSEIDNKVAHFKNIWGRLDESSKKDIKLSISMFEQFEAFDLALFPMLRSLEHELARNFFEPFHASREYASISLFICRDKVFEKTHDSLMGRNNTYPTIGNISFIGRALNNPKARNASDVIRAFDEFLGSDKEGFINICRAFNSYYIGTKRYRIADLRNGIAHGDVKVTRNIDKQCYKAVSKMLYEPPVKLLFEVIRYSKKNGDRY